MSRNLRGIKSWAVGASLVAGVLVLACEDDAVIPEPPSEAIGFSDAYD